MRRMASERQVNRLPGHINQTVKGGERERERERGGAPVMLPYVGLQILNLNLI